MFLGSHLVFLSSLTSAAPTQTPSQGIDLVLPTSGPVVGWLVTADVPLLLHLRVQVHTAVQRARGRPGALGRWLGS